MHLHEALTLGGVPNQTSRESVVEAGDVRRKRNIHTIAVTVEFSKPGASSGSTPSLRQAPCRSAIYTAKVSQQIGISGT